MVEALLLFAAGPISKWNDKEPVADYVSMAALYDVERCIIDYPKMAAPYVYRQPDMPGETTILWTNQHGNTIGRVSLKQEASGVRVLAWAPRKMLVECAPPAD